MKQRKQIVLISKLLRNDFRISKIMTKMNKKSFEKKIDKSMSKATREKKTIKKVKQIKFKKNMVEIISKNEI